MRDLAFNKTRSCGADFPAQVHPVNKASNGALPGIIIHEIDIDQAVHRRTDRSDIRPSCRRCRNGEIERTLRRQVRARKNGQAKEQQEPRQMHGEVRAKMRAEVRAEVQGEMRPKVRAKMRR